MEKLQQKPDSVEGLKDFFGWPKMLSAFDHRLERRRKWEEGRKKKKKKKERRRKRRRKKEEERRRKKKEERRKKKKEERRRRRRVKMSEWKGKRKKRRKTSKKAASSILPQDQKQELNETIDLLKIVDDNGNLEVETKKMKEVWLLVGIGEWKFCEERRERKEKKRKEKKRKTNPLQVNQSTKKKEGGWNLVNGRRKFFGDCEFSKEEKKSQIIETEDESICRPVRWWMMM